MNAKTNTPKIVLATCRCGCNQTITSKRDYRPGHDARHVSTLLARLDTLITEWANDQAKYEAIVGSLASELTSDRLAEKFYSAAHRARTREFDSYQAQYARRGADAKPKFTWHIDEVNYPTGAPSAAGVTRPATSSDDFGYTETEVKVGRWTYPARQFEDGTVQRNTKRDGSGEWVKAN